VVFSRAELCKAGRAGGITVGPTGAVTPHFGGVCGMGVAAEGVTVAACGVLVSGQSLCPLAFAGGSRGGLRAAGREPGAARGDQGSFTVCCGSCGAALFFGGIPAEIGVI